MFIYSHIYINVLCMLCLCINTYIHTYMYICIYITIGNSRILKPGSILKFPLTSKKTADKVYGKIVCYVVGMLLYKYIVYVYIFIFIYI
jgi:hypothetical protein